MAQVNKPSGQMGPFSSREDAERARLKYEERVRRVVAEKARLEIPETHTHSTAVIESEARPGEYMIAFFVEAREAISGSKTNRQAPPEEPREGQRDKFKVLTAGEFLSRPRPEWIVKGVLPCAEIALITAPWGAGKSALAWDLGAAIQRGVDWHGRRVRKGRVVYLVAEGASDFRNRIEAYAKAFDVGAAELPSLIDDVPNLKSAADAELIAQKVGEADVVIIDTLAASFVGDENVSKDLGPVIAHCKFIHRQTGALIVLIAHPGKDVSRGVRGWSGLIGAADAEIVVERSGDHRSAYIRKMKGGIEGPLLDFKLRVVEIGRDEDGGAITSVVLEECDAAPKPVVRPQFAGANQLAIKRALEEVAPAGGAAAIAEVRERALHFLAIDPENATEVRDKKKNLKKSLDDLVRKELVHLHATGYVSLTRAVLVDDSPITDFASEACLQAAIKGKVK